MTTMKKNEMRTRQAAQAAQAKNSMILRVIKMTTMKSKKNIKLIEKEMLKRIVMTIPMKMIITITKAEPH